MWYYNYFTFVERNLESIPQTCDTALKGDKVNDKLKAIKSTIKFVLSAITQMATAVRLDLSSIKVAKSVFELGTWVEALVSDFNTTRNLDEDDEVMLFITRPLRAARIESDSLMLMQVITHLLRNAYRYSEEGSSVKLKCKEVNGSLIIEVHNTGTIYTGDSERLFVPYLKGEEELRNDGLGLYLCSLYMEALDGAIDATCENSTTMFTICLPDVIRYSEQKFPDL